MIRYALTCKDGHQFESWFQSAQAYDKLRAGGLITCAICGGGGIEKSLMAPRIGGATPPAKPKDHPLSEPASDMENAARALKRKIEESADYVGDKFAAEARAMHDGDTPERAIYGEANPTEAKKLLEDGVPVLPLPFTPGRKAN